MKISLKWLNDYLDQPVEPDEAERLLTEQGFPIEQRLDGAGDERDVVLDVEVTSNRSDCLSHIGVAREIVAGSGGRRELKTPDLDFPVDEMPVAELTGVDNRAQDACLVYTARLIRGVRVGPSPDWLVRRLEAVGLRSVNNVVDVTNFVLLETGQPLHAFDMARLKEGRIVVRTAPAGESFVAIDGSRHELKPAMLVIADAQHAVAVAGVMGGLESEVGASTRDIVLESAMFDPLSVRRTSRALKLASDSSYRFERGVDPIGVDAASRRAAGLIHELAGGSIANGVVRVGADPPPARKVAMRVDRCRALLGLDLDKQQMLRSLAALGLAPTAAQGDDRIDCTIPSHRLDLDREVDLIEEVGRLHGLDNIQVRQRIEIVARAPQPQVAARQALREVMVALGFHETVSFTFLRPRDGELFLADGDKPLVIDEASRRVGTRLEPMLRPSVLPSLLLCRKSNQDVGNSDLRLFEIAATWCRRDDRLVEQQRLGLLADMPSNGAAHEAPETGLRDLYGVIDEVLGRLTGHAEIKRVPQNVKNFDSAARIDEDGRSIGTVGVVNQAVLDQFGLSHRVLAAELELEHLVGHFPPATRVRPLPRFPAIERDLSIVVDEAVGWDQIEEHARAAQPDLFESLRFLTIYRGKPVPRGKKSVSLRMVFRDPAATLRHEQVDGQVARVVDRLKSQLRAELRGSDEATKRRSDEGADS